MNPTAIYSKSGKGVQEAAGKTSLLKRPDRAVLSAIDGRATLADVAQKVGKSFDGEFEKLITQLDKDGFIREVSSGTAAAKPGAAKPAAKAAPTAPMDAASDLDFSSFAPPPKPASAPPPKPAAPAPKAAAPAAAAQTSALNKAREEAEAKAAAEREKQKAEAEAKVRAELEAKMRAEAEEKAKDAAADKGKAEAAAKLQAEADAKIKAAREAAVRATADAKAKADAEARKVREEAEQAKREADELKKRLDDERKAREAAERKAKEEGERARKQLEEERKQLEEERKRREEEERKKEAERAERRRQEEEEQQAKRKQREEEERKAEEEREAKRKQREEEDRKAEEEREAKRKQREEEQRLAEEEESRQEEERKARRKQEQEERRQREEAEEAAAEQARAAKKKAKAEAKPAEAKPAEAKSGGAFDSLLSDLDSFGKKDDEERKEKEEAERKAKAEEAKRREREEEERREREEEEEKDRKRRAKEEAKRKEKEEEEAREREEQEAKERKRKEKEEARRKEEEEEAKRKEDREKKREKAKKTGDDDIPITDDDLSDGDVKRDQRELAKAARAAPRPKEARVKLPPPVSGPSVRRRPTKWGKPVTMALVLLLAAGLGIAHLMPIDTKPYSDGASQALGQPVSIGSGRLWLFNGNVQLRLQNVAIGEAKIANVHAFPTIGSLSDDKKVFSRLELLGLSLPQEAAGGALFARVKADNFTVERIVVRQLELPGRLVLPKNLEADVTLDGSGAPRAVAVRGPDGLIARLTPKDSAIDVEVTAGGFTLPVAPEVTFASFGLKGTATRQGMRVEKWDGTLLNGSISGTANVRWGGTWAVDGVFTIRGINAAVFAPALLSEGRGEGTAKFQLSGADPSKLGSSGRFEGNFTVNSGVLGSFDLNQALATGGKRASGRTPFNEMTGQAVYQAGTVALRNVTITAGSQGNMNAGASVDIAPSGALSGRIVADVRTPNQMLRATLNLGGTVRDPQVRN